MNKADNNTLEQEDELIRKLFIEEYESLCRTAYFILGDYSLAETAVQETFLVALRFPEKLHQSEKPVGWIYKTLQYTIKHIQRDRQRVLKWTVSIDTLPEHTIAREDKYSELDDEILKSEDMQLLIEFYQEGYMLKELAEKRGITLGACKMRVKRARERLRKKLE